MVGMGRNDSGDADHSRLAMLGTDIANTFTVSRHLCAAGLHPLPVLPSRMVAGGGRLLPTRPPLPASFCDGWREIPLMPFDSERMTARPISIMINNVKNQGPQCVKAR